MEELSKIAKAYYQASPNNIQKLAQEFFNEMDTDGDGKVELKEFFEFTRAKGRCQMTNFSFFKQLDKDGNGTLDFWEVMTLYYIVNSERPFCDHCKKFITSTYLTCVGCMEDPIGGSFYLCLDCYTGQKCDHLHSGLSRFLDNYLLLGALDQSKLVEVFRSPETRSRTSSAQRSTYAPTVPSIKNYTTYIQNNNSHHYPPSHSAQSPATPTTIVPRQNNWETALAVLDVAVTASVIGSGGFCSIL